MMDCCACNGCDGRSHSNEVQQELTVAVDMGNPNEQQSSPNNTESPHHENVSTQSELPRMDTADTAPEEIR